MDKEVWKDIEGYEGLYQVSNLGKIRRILFKNNKVSKEKIKLIKQRLNKGYLEVVLCKNGKTKTKKVHRLVAETFIPNFNNLPQVNHKDEIKTNNCINNLEWCNNKYNTRYSRAKAVIQYDLQGKIINEWDCIRQVKEKGYDSGNVVKCCQGKYKTYKGYVWKYKEV